MKHDMATYHRLTRLGVLAVGALVASAPGCGEAAATSGSGGGAGICALGATQECVCAGGTNGAQSCRDDGAGWKSCECLVGTGGQLGTGGSGGGAVEPDDNSPFPTPSDIGGAESC